MNYLTDKRGESIDQWNPLPVNDVSISYDKISVSGETVTFVTGAAGFTQSVSVDKAPIMNLLGDRVGSFWREPKNLRCSNNARMGDARVTALVETASSATVTIWDPTYNLEQLFESPAATAGAVIVVRDNAGGELYGWIGGVAATGNSYVLDIYDTAALATQSWVGTLASFTLSANSTQFEIYSNESSVSWTTGTILTKEVKFPEGVAHDPQALTQFFDGLSNGEYGVDYEHGNIHYKKATTGTSDTLAYTTRAATSVVITTSGGSSTLVDDAAFTVASSLVTPVGFLADETTPDSVNEGDAGAARITLDRRIITAGQSTDDAAPETGTRVNVIGALADESATDSVDEGDLGFLRMTLNRRLIVAGQTLDDAAFGVGTEYVQAVGMLADETTPDSIDEGDIGLPRMTLNRRQIVAGQTLDDAAFGIGTEYANASGFLADEATPDSVDEGDIGIARMTLDRKQLTASEQILGTATYTETTTYGSIIGAVRNDTLATLASLDNEITPLQVDANGALYTLDSNSGAIKTAVETIDNTILVDDAVFTPATSSVNIAGFFADETATDSVDEGDVGAARMTLDRKQITSSEYLEDAVFASGGYLSMAGVEIDDPTGLAAMTEGDNGNLKGDLSGRLVVTKGTLDAGEDLTNNVQVVVQSPLAVSTYTNSRDSSTALEASSISKASAGNLYRAFGSISATAPSGMYYILFLDSATLTVDGAVTHLISPIPVNHTIGYESTFTFHSDFGVAAANGIVIVLSTTMVTKTIVTGTKVALFATVLYK